MIQKKDRDTPGEENNVFRCSNCFYFKWAWRYDKEDQFKTADNRVCKDCKPKMEATQRMRKSANVMN